MARNCPNWETRAASGRLRARYWRPLPCGLYWLSANRDKDREMAGKKGNLFIGLGLALLGGGLGAAYWFFLAPPPPPAVESIRKLAGLELLPEESGLVASLDLAALREQAWIFELTEDGPQEMEKDYRDFVESTEFDYTRDLDRLWLGVFGPGESPHVTGVAEGRFSQQKIIAHAERYGGEPEPYRGHDVYQIDDPVRLDRPELEGKVQSFAFAFLSDNRLAFGSDRDRVRLVLDVLAGEAASVASDPERKKHLEASAGGSQFWVANDLSRWMPPALADRASITPLIRELGGGVKVDAEGLTLRGTVGCHEEEQAERLHATSKLALLAGGLFLKRGDNPLARSLADLLGEVKLYAAGREVEARISLSRAQLAKLLREAAEQAAN